MPGILVVDDDPLIRDAIGEALPLQWPGVQILTAADGDEALRLFSAQQPDIVLLDIELPDRSGFEVLRELRRLSDVPIVMVTRRGAEHDQVQALQLGADDYVIKSQGVELLIAHIRAVLRRARRSRGGRDGTDLTVGPLTLSLRTFESAIDGRPLDLTPTELKLLYHLARNAGQIVPYDTLLSRVWGDDSTRMPDHLRVIVSRVQSKISRAGGPRCIENERGIGYRLVRPTAPASRE